MSSITWELKVQTLKPHCNSLSLSLSSAFPKNQIIGGFVYILKLEKYRDTILHSLLKSSGHEEPQPTAGWLSKYLNQSSFPGALSWAQPLNYLRQPSNAVD